MRTPPRPAVPYVTLLAVLLAALTFATRVPAATLFVAGGNTGPTGGLSGLYTMNKATAQLTWIGGLGTLTSDICGIYQGGLAYDPYTDRTYALGCDSSSASTLFLVDRTNARITRIGYLGGAHINSYCSGGLTFDVTNHRLYAVGDVGAPVQSTALAEIDPNTGVATVIGGNGDAGSGTYLHGLGSDPATGILYANGYTAFDQQSRLFVVDKATGRATVVGSHGLTSGRQMNYSGLAFDPVTGTMYGLGSLSSSVSALYTVNKSSGLATLVAPLSASIGVDGAPVFVGTDVLGVPASPASAAVALRAWPNPARESVTFSFALERDADASLEVVDVSGRRLVTVARERLGAGARAWTWDGHDAAGAPVRAGVYFALLRAEGRVVGRATVLMAR